MAKKKTSAKAARFSADSTPALSPETRDLLNVVLVFAGLALCAGLAALAWQRVGPLVMQNDAYRLDPDQLTVTVAPSWVRADVRDEVVEAAHLDASRSFVDPGLTEEIAAAFASHPWVQKVVRVSKAYPARIDVELIYRRPVAVVKLEGTTSLELHPVDINGVRLPDTQYSPNELRSFPRISGIEKLPDIGRASTDPAVAAAARLAALLEEDWQAMQFALIVPPAQGAASADAVFSLVTRAGSTVIWGSVAPEPLADSPLSQARLNFLRAYLAKNKSLDGTAGLHTLDLRKLPATTEKPRTARAQ